MASESNNRIARNTVMLYVRTMLIMLVSLYTSRVILQALGETDFGVYNIIGGFVALLSFLNVAMTNATQRFLNFELGKKNAEQVNCVFSMSLSIYFLIVALFIFFFESIGLWFVMAKLNIPTDRMEAALWVYHFSVLTACVQLLRAPYQASIIAYENMSVYAYVGIAEVILKLGLVYLLLIINQDKLIIYAILIFLTAAIINIFFYIYCKQKYSTCNYKLVWDKILFTRLLSFSGWNLFGGMANVGASHGVNIVLNLFYGVAINAAMGIANQVYAAINSFVSNFQTAFNPQIVKTYAEGDRTGFTSLVFRSSRFSYYLLFVVAYPVMLGCQPLLELWLTIVPEYTIQFVRLFFVFLLIDAMSGPLWMSVQATGVIRNYQIVVSSMILLNLPLIYVCMKLGYPPTAALVIRIIINMLTHLYRLWYLHKHIDFPAVRYMREVMVKCGIVSLLIIPIPFAILRLFEHTLLCYIGAIASSLTISTYVIAIFGLERNERQYIVQAVRSLLVSK